MAKQKTRKSLLKRFKITSKGKILRRHQLGAGHLKRKKSKGALERQSKTYQLFRGEAKKFRKVINI
ncbi:50S ribosomal protein L35 [Candidatus Daviesbacteria bacterium]|nr:50S ribosomal protein L35 [Candidatus Daviesbacteria bacterium]